LKVLIDALAAVAGGSATYFRNFLPILGEIDSGSEYMVLRAPWQDFWTFELPDNIHLVKVSSLRERSAAKRLLWEQDRIPPLIRKYGVDLLFCPADIVPLLAPCKTVLAIRNPNPYLGKNMERGLFYYLDRKIALRALTALSARKADQVIFVSNFSQSVVCKQLKIPQPKTNVVYHGLSPSFCRATDRSLSPTRLMPQPYILSVSSISGHKNYPFLVRVFAHIVKNFDFAHHLVIAGNHTFRKDVDKIKRIAQETGIEDRVHLLGYVSYDELPEIYSQADLFVFPSLVETFGHPLVEAMASGIPVAASNAASLPEICDDAAVYFDPTDTQEAVNKISHLLVNRSLREDLVQKGLARAAEFSWEKAVRETLAVFQKALG